jgi:hypothetical protein
MRRVQQGYTPITDFGGKKQVNFDALFSSDSEDETAPAAAAAPTQTEAPRASSPAYPYQREESEDPISTWTQKVAESFAKASQAKKPLSPDFKESLGRLSFFRKLVPKEKTSTTTVNSQ